MKPQKKSFGAEISAELADTFSDYVEKTGFQKFRSIEAALRLFMRAPVDIQVACMFDNSNTSTELKTAEQVALYQTKIQDLVAKGLPASLADNFLKSRVSAPARKKKGHGP